MNELMFIIIGTTATAPMGIGSFVTGQGEGDEHTVVSSTVCPHRHARRIGLLVHRACWHTEKHHDREEERPGATLCQVLEG